MCSISSREDIILNSLNEFYKNNNKFNEIIKVITGKDIISLRVIDYFITNYCKFNNIKINNINIYFEYKNMLKSYNKKFFDPFCRINVRNNTNKIIFKFDDNNIIITTIGQLNFFKWIINNNILYYIRQYHTDILNHMVNNKKNIINNII